jgi:hypothetical protein
MQSALLGVGSGDRRNATADSTGRCNDLVKSLGWRIEA